MSANGYETDHWIVVPVEIEDGGGRVVARWRIRSRDPGIPAEGYFKRRQDAVACAAAWEAIAYVGHDRLTLTLAEASVALAALAGSSERIPDSDERARLTTKLAGALGVEPPAPRVKPPY